MQAGHRAEEEGGEEIIEFRGERSEFRVKNQNRYKCHSEKGLFFAGEQQ
jgi:hypothetical protein